MTLSFLDRLRPRGLGPAPAPSAPVFGGLAQVRAYWEGLRLDGQLPQRSDLDPRGLTGVLDRIFLAERIGRGLVQLRIAGSGLADFAGADVRGLPLSCLFTPESRPLLAQTLETVLTSPAIAEIDLGSDRLGGGALFARLLLLPLADRTNDRLVLGAVGFSGAASPCKLQILARREQPLPSLQQSTIATPLPAQPIRQKGHLALVHSND